MILKFFIEKIDCLLVIYIMEKSDMMPKLYLMTKSNLFTLVLFCDKTLFIYFLL